MLCSIHIQFFGKNLNIIDMEGQKFDAYISYFNSLKSFYIHNKNDQRTIEKILNNLQRIESEHLTLDCIKRGDLLAALDSQSGLWYRAKVLNTEGTAFKVEYIDYGHSELSSSFKKLPEKLSSYPVMAYHCTLDNVYNAEYIITTDNEVYNTVFEFMTCIDVVVTFLNNKQPHLVKMKWDKRNINICLNNIVSYGITIKTHESLKRIDRPGDKMRVNLIYTASIDEFYVLTEDSKEIEKKIEYELENIPTWEPVTEYTIGKMVIAKSETDNRWYRVRILDTFKDGKCTCYFVDYGIKEYCSEFYKAVGYLESAPPFIKRCSLYMPNIKKRSKELFYYLSKSFVNEMELSKDKKMMITIIKTGEPCKVELYVDGLNAAKLIEPKSVIVSKVAHINALTVQLNTPWRVFFLSELSKIKTLCRAKKLRYGRIYGALMNNQWYRVKLYMHYKDYEVVAMIDMGNSLIRVKELYKLPPFLKNDKSLVMFCALGLDEKNVDRNKLLKLCNNGYTQFTMIVLENNNINGHVIRLFLNNEDVLKLVFRN
ncbi:Tudor domain [Cinara cedri]|uniref:Tudor domain n=1 Tax=Cinara cedri TaxID=506608 RepID=A0A5E4N7V8_9HEMI|nr:Tudor domain [Cinara cedri]